MKRVKRVARMGEERAAEIAVRIAKRVEANHPDRQPLSVLTAATATLLLAGFADPKDRHVLHAAERMRERMAEPDRPLEEREERELSTTQSAERDRLEREIWQPALERLQTSVPESTYRIWFEPLILCGRDRDGLLVTAAEKRVRDWAERRYAALILEAVQDVQPKVAAVKFVNWVPAGTLEKGRR